MHRCGTQKTMSFKLIIITAGYLCAKLGHFFTGWCRLIEVVSLCSYFGFGMLPIILKNLVSEINKDWENV